MGKLTKNQKLAAEKIEAGKAYSLKEAAQLVKEITYTKFDASLDIDVRLGVDPRKANQMVRGVVSLPHGTGKVVRVLVLCTPDAEAAAKEAGADYVGLDEYIEKIKGGWTDIDVIITMPSIMGKIGALGRVLGLPVPASIVVFEVELNFSGTVIVGGTVCRGTAVVQCAVSAGHSHELCPLNGRCDHRPRGRDQLPVVPGVNVVVAYIYNKRMVH